MKEPRTKIFWAALCYGVLASSVGVAEPQAPVGARDLFVTVGKSVVIDSPVTIQRISVADGAMAEAVAVTPREVLVNGKTPGETSLIIWQEGGNRLMFDLSVRPSPLRLNAVREELNKELAGQDVSLSIEQNNVYLRGTVGDRASADRAVTIARTLGNVINLLHVKVPPVDPQILLKVRFANVDRAASTDLGANLISTGTLNTTGSVTTGQFPSSRAERVGEGIAEFTLTDALNVFLFRPDLNLGATIRALASKRLLQLLAEPNLLAMNGKPASFLAGGEFPFPTLQGGAAVGSVTIQFREFGVRINFVPTVTPRGTIRLEVTPEVSALDFANGLVFQGFNVPALSTRRVRTFIELENGQSFGLAGLLDNRAIESLNKIPGLGDIPFFGKLFQSRSVSQNNTELLVLVTPELVRPVPADMPAPDVKMPKPFLRDAPTQAPRTPGMEVTGPVPVKFQQETIPYEQLAGEEQPPPPAQPVSAPIQLVPVPLPQPQPQQPPQPPPTQPPTPPEATRENKQ